MLSNPTPSQPEGPSAGVIPSHKRFLFPGVRLLTSIRNFLPLLTTLHNHLSTPLFFLPHLDQKVNLACFSQHPKAPRARRLFGGARARLAGSTPRGPDLPKHHLRFSLLTRHGQERPTKPTPCSRSGTNTNRIGEKRGSPSKPSSIRKPMRIRPGHQACDQYTEGARWMAGGNAIRVTAGPGGTSWLRCSASKLNTDRKPRV